MAALLGMATAMWAGRSAAAEEPLSRLESVEVETQVPPGLRVRLRGTRAPDFSVEEREAPFALVIDWAGSRLASDARGFGPADGFLRSIRLTQLDVESEPTTRVVIELAAPAPYSVVTDGARLEVLIGLPPGEPLRADLPASARDPGSPGPKQTLLAVVSPPSPGTDGPLVEPAVEIPTEPPEVSTRRSGARSVVVPVAIPPSSDGAPSPVAGRGQTTPPGYPTAEPPELELPPREPSPAEVAPARPGPRLPPPQPVRALPLALAAPALGPALDEEGPAREPDEAIPGRPPELLVSLEQARRELARSADEPPRSASLGPTLRNPEAMIPRRPPPPPAPALTAREPGSLPAALAAPNVDQASARAGAGGAGQAEPGRRERLATFRPPPAPAAPTSSPEPARVLTYIGFRHIAGTSRVFARLDGPPRVRTSISADGRTFVLELIETRVEVMNNTRPLDTTYFPGPVRMVQAKVVGSSTRVEVRLRDDARWTIKQLGQTVAVDFVATE